MPTFAPHLPAPTPSYSQARENLVRAIPSKLLCLLACGGKDCRYEGPNCWKLNQQVIRGLFSSWVTDDIIAMTRPSNFLIQKYNIIDQFQRLNVRSIINMQLPGEHTHCGPPLDPESGFTYSPQIFMENDIYFYNFGMPDFGVSSLGSFINAVKVLAFAVTEGRVAVHCHAGLGRTGVLIACYLIYTLRLSPSEAIHFVRIKRPRSIQTRAQISQVFAFARLLGAQLTQYPDVTLRHGAPFSLQHYLNRQALLLHGQEARRLRHTPKVVHLLCLRLSCLALGLSSPPEIHQELEKRSALRTLSGTVRETLVAQRYVALLSEDHKDSGSISSWDDLHERKEDVMVFRRSYSDSYLSKLTQDEELELGDLSPFNGVMLSEQQKTTKQDSNKLNNPDPSLRVRSSSSTKRFKASAINVLHKCSSSTKVCRIQPNQGKSSLARAVAKAMGEHGSPGETVTQRSALLQEELNNSDCGWALLVTESDPNVLCSLLWTWLENLKDPVLSVEDIENMRVGVSAKTPSISVLKKVMPCLDPYVGTWRPHRPRGPIAALYKSPGPKYSLPTLTGTSKHDPTKYQAPMYSMGIRHRELSASRSPGPKYFIPSNISTTGRDGTPAFSIKSRAKELELFKVPGPGQYFPEKAENSLYPKSPSFSLYGRSKEGLKNLTPGPATYNLPPVIGPKVVSKTSAPAPALSGRSKTGSFHEDLKKTPGPAAYNVVDPNIYGKKPPQFSMSGRNFTPEEGTKKPGPGAHYPEHVTVAKAKAPSFSFGLRHSQYIAPLMEKTTECENWTL